MLESGREERTPNLRPRDLVGPSEASLSREQCKGQCTTVSVEGEGAPVGQRPSRAGELLRSIRSILKALVLLGLEPVKKQTHQKMSTFGSPMRSRA